MLPGGDAQVARRAPIAQRGQRLLHLLQMRTEALNESLTRLGRYHAAGGAGQQPHIETRFEMAHGMAERRLRHAELGRRAVKLRSRATTIKESRSFTFSLA
jgi:hypothetical protein